MNELTETAAKELGRALRFMRHARSLTLRDAGRAADLSVQYVQNIGQATRKDGRVSNVSEDAYLNLGRGLGVPEPVILDLLLRARVQSALEQRGLGAEQVRFVWRGVEQRLAEVGYDARVDLAKVVADMLGDSGTTGRSDEQQKVTTPRKRLVSTGKPR